MELGDQIAQYLENAIVRWKNQRYFAARRFADSIQDWFNEAWPKMPDEDWRPGFEAKLAQWEADGVKVTADSKQRFVEWLSGCERTMHARRAHSQQWLERWAATSESPNGSTIELDSEMIPPKRPLNLGKWTDEDLIPKSYYREHDGIVSDPRYRLRVLGQRGRATGKLEFDPGAKARLLFRAIEEERAALNAAAAAMSQAVGTVRDTGELDVTHLDELAANIKAGFERYSKLMLAFAANQRQLSANDPYARFGVGVLEHQEEFVPGFFDRLREESKATERKWADDAAAYGTQILWLEGTKTTLDVAMLVTGLGGLAVNAGKLGAREGAKYLAIELTKMAVSAVATAAAAKGAQAAGVNETAIDVGMQLAFLWIQLRAIRTPPSMSRNPAKRRPSQRPHLHRNLSPRAASCPGPSRHRSRRQSSMTRPCMRGRHDIGKLLLKIVLHQLRHIRRRRPVLISRFRSPQRHMESS